jgi:putative DNA base modification enzyme with NMAD domain
VARVYFYKLTTDDGGAPCVQDSLLSLAICKPMIRSTAAVGDLVFGFAANSLHRDNRLLYIARITEKMQNGRYYLNKRLALRGDCVYERRGNRFVWRQGALHHGPNDLVHDLGEYPDYPKANVLLSTDFRYLGEKGTPDYKTRYHAIKEAVENLGQGHRVRHDEPLLIELLALKQEVWRDPRHRQAGQPSNAPRCGISHRSKSCGVLQNC